MTINDTNLGVSHKANRLWGSRCRRTFFEVNIFNPHAKSCPKTISDAYKYQESVKTLK